MLRKLFLTFDVEDFISDNSIFSLKLILQKLKQYDLKGLFFITGHMAKKIASSTETVEELHRHQIGYHTSSHTVHPTIFEFTDTEYKEAFRISLERETSDINPLSGEIEGPGGYYTLKQLFPNKQIISFRAPGYCWSPPHLEALKTLGFEHDFSANISKAPVFFKGITFHPFPLLPTNWWGTRYNYRLLARNLVTQDTSVLTIHPSAMINEQDWDLIYLKANPSQISPPPPKKSMEAAILFRKFELLLKAIKKLSDVRLLEVTPVPKRSKRILNPSDVDILGCYHRSMEWAHYLGYKPRFLYGHFLNFFDAALLN